jgi:biotin carboxylase
MNNLSRMANGRKSSTKMNEMLQEQEAAFLYEDDRREDGYLDDEDLPDDREETDKDFEQREQRRKEARGGSAQLGQTTKLSKSPSSLEGKRILILGARNGARSVSYFTAARKEGAFVCAAMLPQHEASISRLIQQESSEISSGIQLLVVPDLSSEDTSNNIAAALIKRAGASFDGCVTFQEDLVQLNADLCAIFELPGCDPKGVEATVNKYKFRQRLAELNLGSAYCATLENFLLGNKPTGLIFPVVLKPAEGAGSEGVFLVHSMANLLERIEMYERKNPDRYEEWMVEEYLQGPELGVELIMSRGECLFASVMECSKTPPPIFQGTGRFYPTSLGSAKDQETIQECISAATLFGLDNSVIDIDCKHMGEGRGPVILEINCRMGGHSVGLMNQECFGVNLVTENFRCGCGVKTAVNCDITPPPACFTKLVLSKKSGVLTNLNSDTFFNVLRDYLPENLKKKLKAARLGRDAGFYVDSDVMPAILAFVYAEGNTLTEAEANAKSLKKYASRLVNAHILTDCEETNIPTIVLHSTELTLRLARMLQLSHYQANRLLKAERKHERGALYEDTMRAPPACRA